MPAFEPLYQLVMLLPPMSFVLDLRLLPLILGAAGLLWFEVRVWRRHR